MNRQISTLLPFRHSLRRWAMVLSGFLLVAFAGFHLFNVSAQADAVEKIAQQNLTTGRLAFSVGVYGPGAPSRSIATSNPDGSGGAGVTSTPSPNEPAWSPDGTRIAFASTDVAPDSPLDIFVINSDGSGQTNLTNVVGATRLADPSWSITGKIAYERAGFNNSSPQIWTMNEDGSEQARFSAITQPVSSDPAWSPDGSKMAFASEGDIWVINADGTGEQRVTNTASGDAAPAWSPDGSKIVFGRGGSIIVVNADGTNAMPLGNGIRPPGRPMARRSLSDAPAGRPEAFSR